MQFTSLDDFIPAGIPVRIFEAFVEKLGLTILGIRHYKEVKKSMKKADSGGAPTLTTIYC